MTFLSLSIALLINDKMNVTINFASLVKRNSAVPVKTRIMVYYSKFQVHIFNEELYSYITIYRENERVH